MRKWIFAILLAGLALSCVGQKDDPVPEPEPEPDPELSGGGQEEGGAYYRRSLILEFTGTWCVNCPKMENAIKDAQSQRPGRIVSVGVHCLSVDKMALMPLSNDLIARFGVKAYPSAVTDLDPESLVTVASAELLLAQCDRLLGVRPESAGISIQTTSAGASAEVKLEAKPVRAGDYSLHVLLLEDGIVASQTGASADYVHNNVLRAWFDSDDFAGRKEGDVIGCGTTFEAAEGMKVVAFVCRNGIVDNVTVCKIGENAGYEYEETI